MPGSLIKTERPLELSVTRALGPFEHLIWLVDQWTPLRVVLVVRIEGSSVSTVDLSSALLQAQRRHPMLRTAIHANENGEPHFVPSSAPIPLCVIQRADPLQWLREAEALSAIPFEPGDSPLLRAALVQGEAVSELILVAHHSIGDGVSAMYLVRDLLESMEGYKLKLLPPRPSLEVFVFGIKQAPDGRAPVPPIRSRPSQMLERLQEPVLQTMEIGSRELEQILACCRAANTTLQGALLAAVLLSLPPRENLQCLSPVNIRRLSSLGVEDFGLYISSGMASLDRKAPRNFWALARAARQQVLQALDPQVLNAKTAAIAGAVVGGPSPQSVYEQVWRNFGYDAVLTNLGLFPDLPNVNRFRVTAVYPVLSDASKPAIALATGPTGMCLTMTAAPPMNGLLPSIIDLLRRNIE
jgi:hypothetical protein